MTIEHLWLGLPVFVLLWKNFLFPLPVLDFWWHLKMGKVIATTGSIPNVDLFSFTAAGKPFILQNWLAELGYYGLYQLGDLPLVMFFNTLLVLATFLPLYFLCLEAATSLRLGVAVGTLAALGVLGTVRPQTFSFLMFSLYYFVLVRYRSRSKDLLWVLPLLMVFWVNLHGAFVLGLGLMALFIVSEGSRRLIGGAGTDVLTVAEIRRLAIVLAVCALATLVNPEGYKVYEYVRTVMADGASQQLVAEWQPPRVNDLGGIVLFYGPFFLTLLAFMYARSKPDLTELALFIVFGVFGLMSLRNGAWFSIVAYPLLARYCSDVDFRKLQPLRRYKLIDRPLCWFAERSSGGGPTFPRMNLLLASLAIFVLVLQTPWVRPTVYKTSLIQQGTPIGAIDFIEQHGLKGNIFHPQIFGDYLIWRLWPEQKSFFDGRVHIFGLDFVRKYLLLYHDSHWEELLENWKVQYLLLSKSAGETDSLDMIASARQSHRWKTLYEDEVSVLMEKAN